MDSNNQRAANALSICVIGLGGGGYHAEAERILSAVNRPLNLILIFAGPDGGILKWSGKQRIVSSYKVRSPMLIGDSYLRGFFGMINNFYQALKILSIHQPDLILGVGSIQSLPFFIAGKLLRVRSFYVESITRISSLSTTGKAISRIGLADEIYTAQSWNTQ